MTGKINILSSTINSISEGVDAPVSEGKANILFAIPRDESNALIVKFIADPRSGGKPIVVLDSYGHYVGDSESDKRYHPCRKSLLGNNEESPENDALQNAITTMTAIKKQANQQGDTTEYKKSPEFVKQRAIADLFRKRKTGYVYAVKPNSDEIFAIKLGPAMLNRLQGVDETPYRKGVASVIKEMEALGKTPFVIGDAEKNKIGWVKIWKTGEKLSTEYHIEPAMLDQVVEINGKKMRVQDDQEFELGKKIAESDLTLDDFVDFVEYEIKQNMWTLEESREFVESAGTKVPERVINQAKSSPQKEADDSAAPEVGGLSSGTVASPSVVPNF